MDTNIEKSSKEVIMIRSANIYENLNEDIIYLIGKRKLNGKNSIYKDLEIAISDGENGNLTYINLKNMEGYNPKIILGEFKKVGNYEILFTLEDELEEKGIRVIIYTVENRKIVTIFDSNIYLLDKEYKVKYKDKYKISLFDVKKNIEFNINIEDKYLKKDYSLDGILKDNDTAKVLGIYEVNMIKNSNNETFDLLLKQNIIGNNINDILGEIIITLRFTDNTFNEIDRKVYSNSIAKINLNSRKEELIMKKYDFSKVDFIESEYKENLRIERAIEKEFSLNPNFDKLTYLYNSVRLNESLNYQIIVYLEGPKFCSEKGGTAIILEQKNNEYIVASRIKDISPPIIVCENMSSGYKDLIVKSIKKDKIDFRILKYNGNAYPIDPSKEEKLRASDKIIGIAIISDDLFYKNGIEYKI